MEIRTVLSFVFNAAHRMYNCNSNEGFIHGHTFKVEICLQRGLTLDERKRTQDSLNLDGNVMFTEQYNEIEHWIYNNLDHAFIINEFDENIQKACHFLYDKGNTQKVFVMPMQPTCENIAVTLEKVFRGIFFEEDIQVISISVNDGQLKAEVVCL
jgi:6-pyruvoyl-tetrahydropterin synthase